jgi:hypothetical protein
VPGYGAGRRTAGRRQGRGDRIRRPSERARHRHRSSADAAGRHR